MVQVQGEETRLHPLGTRRRAGVGGPSLPSRHPTALGTEVPSAERGHAGAGARGGKRWGHLPEGRALYFPRINYDEGNALTHAPLRI